MEILREYNGIQIPQREDGYISLTKMGSATNKRLSDVLKTNRMQQTIKAYENLKEGKALFRDKNQTWGSLALGMEFAYQAQVEFYFWFMEEFIDKIVKQHDAVDEFYNAIPHLLEKTTNGKQTFPLITESEHRDYLTNLLQGVKEVSINNGQYFVDVLTEDRLIEVKTQAHWKTAVEQLQTYHVYFPTKVKTLILFSNSVKYPVHYICIFCKPLGIEVGYLSSSGELNFYPTND